MRRCNPDAQTMLVLANHQRRRLFLQGGRKPASEEATENGVGFLMNSKAALINKRKMRLLIHKRRLLLASSNGG